MRFIELFAGIGGFRYGLEKIRCSKQETMHDKTFGNTMFKGVKEQFKDRELQRSQFTCVWANEWDKYACQIYRKNFGDRNSIYNSRETQAKGELSSKRKGVKTHNSKGSINNGKSAPILFNKGNKRMCDKDPEVCKSTTKVRNKKGQHSKQSDRYSKGQYDCPELIEGNITKIPAESIPDHDLLTAGFPCPSYSIAGKRKGFKDPRGALFFEICRIAKVKKPALLLLENVKGLLNHQGGETFRIILDSLSELGYDCEWEVFNSAYYSVPQHRERVYIIGHLRGTGGQKIFPLGEAMRKGDEGSKRQTTGCIKGVSGHIQNDDTYILQDKRQSNEVRIYKGKTPAVTSTWGMGGGNVPMVGDYRYDEGLRIRKNNICPTIRQESKGQDHSKSPLLIGKKNIRRLTPTECERLQGFPDGWTEGISDTQRYKCLGNAVTTNVITEIGKKILEGDGYEK